MKRKRYGPQTKNLAVRFYVYLGWTLQQVADDIGATKPTVRKWILDEGHDLRREGCGQKPKVKNRKYLEGRAVVVYRREKSVRRTGKILGMGREWVRRALHRRGEELLFQGRPSRASHS